MARKGRFWLGVFVGAVAGAITTLLYAPKAGSEIRRDIKEKSGQVKVRAGEMCSGVRERASEAATTAGEHAKRATERNRETVETGESESRKAAKAGGKAAAKKHGT